MPTTLVIRESLGVDSFIVNTGTGSNSMKATVKRYRPNPNRPRNPREPGYILLFAHGVGFHKEHWEPVIQHLFNANRLNQNPTRILEAWAIDHQSHGQAALLNSDLFKSTPGLLPTFRDYGEAFASLYWSGLLGDITKGVQKLVLIGHSAGAIGCIYATSFFATKEVPFEMVIMVDISWFGPTGNESTKLYKIARMTTPARRFQWSSKEAAYDWMKTRVPWKAWDPRILKIYVEHGLRPTVEGVELACHPLHESAAFSMTPDVIFLNNQLEKMCQAIPCHLAFGSRNDMFSREVQNSLHDPQVGHPFHSITRIEGAGHLVLQEKPDGVSNYLYHILQMARNSENVGALPNARL